VEAFLRGACRFDEIMPLVAETVEAADAVTSPSLEDIVAADRWARGHAAEALKTTSGGRR
jgi:1-deoxy-D-xylulose-5-phosphate reductoisomerase